ncbi:F-box-like domain superfamily [Arabidopsis suecica]|uniref:F-box-like domain superfamily n=1 Tax=Arabidopsis suecica TaxID=45249 RepID=A0A8T1XRA3_ARASU|nr:F-box-like domain superfamily [Arabidopsis suecica]
MKKRTPELTPNPSLPDDLLLTCFARVSRLYYPTLSLVSKSCRSLITSPELYKTRSFLNHSESCLYVCLKLPPDPNPRWFTLCRKPNRSLTNITKKKKKKKKKSSGSHTWHEAPSMLMERRYPVASVVDGKIYVVGGLKDFDSSKWMEVFDSKTQTWEFVLSPPTPVKRFIFWTAVIEEEIYMFGENGVAYKPEEDTWKSEVMSIGVVCHCVVDNVLYCYFDGINWYDSDIGHWIELKGLEGLPEFARYSNVFLVDYGGKIAVFWDKDLPSSGCKSRAIWCAVISLERCNNSREIQGNIEWLDVVLTVPYCYSFVNVLVATV